LGFLTYRLLCHTPAKIRSRAVLIRSPHISAPLCLPHNAGTSRRFLECVATSGGVPVTAAAYTAGWLTGGCSLLRPEAPRSTTVIREPEGHGRGGLMLRAWVRRSPSRGGLPFMRPRGLPRKDCCRPPPTAAPPEPQTTCRHAPQEYRAPPIPLQWLAATHKRPRGAL
jgi:hypothetical protein